MVRLWSIFYGTFRISYCELAKRVGQLRINFGTNWKITFLLVPPLAQCTHIYCYISLLSRMRRSHPKNLTCPHWWCVATAIIHHQPIRLYNGVTYNRNISQEVLGQSEGHFCSLCHLHCFLHETVLGTFDTTEPRTHIFAMNVLYN
jgi:hypothetical protein